ncbi:Fur family transcriptional regulator [Desulfuromonas carbonis]|uniref:Fur family transcriptional regulator n=1 Tax=Desulfuromonas sp. DDH964 TaxID=1823759 RepID=UPI00078B4212|nr:transcriptional repressor [Desulfuromonas sp. DDH964]AMV70979.1 ferric uptake regulation protein Fur [Desulfuromonas sp. DDH964]
MKSPQTRLDEILTKLRQRECRITPQRIAILRALLHSDQHPSVEMVYRQVSALFPTTSLATVYKTVNLLKEIGEVLEIPISAGRNRYDGNNPSPHPHLICTRCTSVSDPAVSLLGPLQDEVAQATGYKITSHQVQLFGLCPACQQK